VDRRAFSERLCVDAKTIQIISPGLPYLAAFGAGAACGTERGRWDPAPVGELLLDDGGP
jgi:hypothetical protein